MDQSDTINQASALEYKVFPLWAKLLIALTVSGFVSIVGLSIMFYIWVYPKLLNANQPEAISKVAAHIATFSPYPPHGFRFAAGFDLFNIYTLMAEHIPDHQSILFISYPFIQGDASVIVDAIAANSLQVSPIGAHFSSITSKGEFQVAHQNMPYVIGTVSNQGRLSEALFGCVVLRKSNRTVCILTLSPSGRGFDFKGTLDTVTLLGSIERFD